MIKYKGKTPVKPGSKVQLLVDCEPWCTRCVVDALATQFTVSVNGVTRFFFYDDKGLTWRPLKDG